MKKVTYFLPDEQIKGLKKLSEKSGAPVSELIRRAISAYLKKNN